MLNSIDFAVRCCLMIRFNRPGGVQAAGEQLYPWREINSLHDAIVQAIPQQVRDPVAYTIQFDIPDEEPLAGTATRPVDKDREFSDLFNLADMDKLAGFTIQYTPNLLEHLRVVRFRNRKFRVTVYIFPHAHVLELLQNG